MKKNIYIFSLALIIFFGSFSLSNAVTTFIQPDSSQAFLANASTRSGLTTTSTYFFVGIPTSTLMQDISITFKYNQSNLLTNVLAPLSINFSNHTCTFVVYATTTDTYSVRVKNGVGACYNKTLSEVGSTVAVYLSTYILGGTENTYGSYSGFSYPYSSWQAYTATTTSIVPFYAPYMIVEASSTSANFVSWQFPSNNDIVSKFLHTLVLSSSPVSSNSQLSIWISTSSDFAYANTFATNIATTSVINLEIGSIFQHLTTSTLYYGRAVLYDSQTGTITASSNISFTVSATSGILPPSTTSSLPNLPNLWLSMDDCSAYAGSFFFSSSTLAGIQCHFINIGKTILNILFSPLGISRNFLSEQITFLRTLFPFNIFFGFQTGLLSIVQSSPTSTVNFSLPLAPSGLGSMSSTTVTITSSTVGNIVGASNWVSMREFMSNIIWVGLGAMIIFTVI